MIDQSQYAPFFIGDPNNIVVDYPQSAPKATLDDDDKTLFLRQVVNAVKKEIMRQEHKNIFHDAIFTPAIEQFALLLRPWLLLLSTIFLLLLIIGIIQLVLLFTRKQIMSTEPNYRSVSPHSVTMSD